VQAAIGKAGEEILERHSVVARSSSLRR